MQTDPQINDELLESLCADARTQFESRAWFNPYFRLEAMRAQLSIETLVAEGDLNAASVWREAPMLDVTRDINAEIVSAA